MSKSHVVNKEKISVIKPLTLGLFIFVVSSLSACTGKDKSTNNSVQQESKINTIKTELFTKPELNFSILNGKIYNKFFRQGKVAAHTLLTSGTSPRLIVAFPAGNSGVSLWFKSVDKAVQWQKINEIVGISQQNEHGDLLYGIRAQLTTTAKELVVEEAVLSNVRVLRDYMHNRTVPSAIQNEVVLKDNSITWYRDRLDGKGGYKLQVDVLHGSVAGGHGKPVVFTAADNEPLTLRLSALSGDESLTPITKSELFVEGYNGNPLSQNILAFLSYKEKMLAGSWRFSTYFGRDTLMSVRLLMPVLKSAVIEASLGSVIERLADNGEVAHEEDLAEFAILRHMSEVGNKTASPIFDYKMIDDNFMLAPIVAEYLLENEAGKNNATAFLQRKTLDGKRYGDRLIENFNFVISETTEYAANPEVGNLIKLRGDLDVGEWRDSNEGLGFGKIPYNVNSIFVPASLSAIARLYSSGLLTDYIGDDQSLKLAKNISKVWQEKASSHFKVTLTSQQVRESVTQYADYISVSDVASLAAIEETPFSFYAVSLDSQGKPIPVLNSDYGFSMLFTNPSSKELESTVKSMLLPFPLGLLTPVGMVVANPVYADKETQKYFTNSHYHGTVIWSWQQALFAAGLERQLLRSDLTVNTKKILLDVQIQLWDVINAVKEVSNSELWSWSFMDGEYTMERFGQRNNDLSESNAAQLWSTVYLSISDPSEPSVTK